MTKKHVATAELKQVVENAVASGFRQEEIAALLGLSDRTLRTRYRQQLDKGAVKVHAKVTAWLLDLALQDDDSASACRPQAYGCERVSAGAKPTRRRCRLPPSSKYTIARF